MFLIFNIQNTSSRRLNCLETLYEYLQAASAEMFWLRSKENETISHDWSKPEQNIPDQDDFSQVRKDFLA